MSVTQRLEFRQSQSLVMTPQLQQAIKLLQLSSLDLAAHVEQELEQNPLLEREEAGDADATEGTPEKTAENAADEPERPGSDSLDHATASTLPERDQAPLDTDFANDYTNDDEVWPDGRRGLETGRGGSFEGEGTGLDQCLSREPSLRERLLEQLHMDCDDATDRIIGLHLIDQLDEAGYLDADLAALAELLGCPQARIEKALARMQRFEPSGIFARDLRECLALQLAERDRLDPAMSKLLDNLDHLAKRDRVQLKRLCGVDDEDLAEMVAEVKALNPKPALAYDHRVAEPVVPDVLVRRHRGGGWSVELNSDTLPRVLINRQYYARISGELRDKAERDYLSGCYQSANWLIKALHQRATTVLKVAEEIVRRQDGFLEKGLQHLRPLTLLQVAETVDLHESTVSRAIANKYMASPRGIYELKYFFNAAIAGADGGESHAAESVRQRIKELIAAETGAKVLSDDAIVAQLRRDGIDIARRTVAKYREALRIPSSVQRRRDKALSR